MNEKSASITQKTKYLFWCNVPYMETVVLDARELNESPECDRLEKGPSKTHFNMRNYKKYVIVVKEVQEHRKDSSEGKRVLVVSTMADYLEVDGKLID